MYHQAPNQSYATPPPSNNYDFIMNGGNMSNGPSKKMRIAVVAVGIIVLLIIGMIVSKILTSQNQNTYQELTSLTQMQNEIVRVADIGIAKARSPEAKNLAVTTKQTIATDKEALLAYLKLNKHPVSPADLHLGRDPNTDELLKIAEQNNRFDATFLEILNAELTNYQRAVKITYQNTEGKNARELLTKTYDNINTLAGKQN